MQNISETVSNVPLHIGVGNLKAIAYYTILPLFVKWSKNHPLSIDDLRLRSKEWVELIPLGPGAEDVEAISGKFLQQRGKSKAQQYRLSKVVELYLEISFEIYTKVSEHLDELQLEDIHDQPGITESEHEGGQDLADSEIGGEIMRDAAKKNTRKRQLSVRNHIQSDKSKQLTK